MSEQINNELLDEITKKRIKMFKPYYLKHKPQTTGTSKHKLNPKIEAYRLNEIEKQRQEALNVEPTYFEDEIAEKRIEEFIRSKAKSRTITALDKARKAQRQKFSRLIATSREEAMKEKLDPIVVEQRSNKVEEETKPAVDVKPTHFEDEIAEKRIEDFIKSKAKTKATMALENARKAQRQKFSKYRVVSKEETTKEKLDPIVVEQRSNQVEEEKQPTISVKPVYFIDKIAEKSDNEFIKSKAPTPEDIALNITKKEQKKQFGKLIGTKISELEKKQEKPVYLYKNLNELTGTAERVNVHGIVLEDSSIKREIDPVHTYEKSQMFIKLIDATVNPKVVGIKQKYIPITIYGRLERLPDIIKAGSIIRLHRCDEHLNKGVIWLNCDEGIKGSWVLHSNSGDSQSEYNIAHDKGSYTWTTFDSNRLAKLKEFTKNYFKN